MFIRSSDNDSLVFIKSKSVKAFPCGRRRSQLIDSDGNSDTVAGYYIPFDPEARLNTEANNRKHTSINGFKQDYIKSWNNDLLSLVLAGYLFDIKLKDDAANPAYDYSSVNTFGNSIINTLNNGTESTKIYAAVRLEQVEFFSGTSDIQKATTEILRNQTATDGPIAGSLDLYINNTDITSPDSYYFSGLSFSTIELSDDDTVPEDQRVISLCILSRESATSDWQIHQPSLLPVIDHGATDSSVIIHGDTVIEANLDVKENVDISNDLTVGGCVSANVFKCNDRGLLQLTIGTSGNNKAQLQFTSTASTDIL